MYLIWDPQNQTANGSYNRTDDNIVKLPLSSSTSKIYNNNNSDQQTNKSTAILLMRQMRKGDLCVSISVQRLITVTMSNSLSVSQRDRQSV